MSVRAKMRCTKKSQQKAGTGAPGEDTCETVELQPVYSTGPDDPNKSWSKWTPSGQVTLSITNQEAVNQFELGKSYFVDFTPAE